jgi:hypothetical protein
MTTIFTITKIKEFKTIIKYLKQLTADALWDLEPDGIHYYSQNDIIINMFIPKNNLKNYKLGTVKQIGFNLSYFWKLIKNIPKNEEIIFHVNKNHFTITVKERDYMIKSVNLDIEDQVKTKFNMKNFTYFQFKANEYSKIIKNILRLTNKMAIHIKDKKIIFESVESASGTIEIKRYIEHNNINRKIYRISNVHFNKDDVIKVFVNDRLTICFGNSMCEFRVSYPQILF